MAGSQPVPPDATLPAKLAAAEAELRDILLAGGDTGGIRTTIVQYQREIADKAAAEAARAAEIERAEQAEVSRAGAELAAESAARITDMMAALQPPPWPLPA